MGEIKGFLIFCKYEPFWETRDKMWQQVYLYLITKRQYEPDCSVVRNLKCIPPQSVHMCQRNSYTLYIGLYTSRPHEHLKINVTPKSRGRNISSHNLSVLGLCFVSNLCYYVQQWQNN